jgi:hypothetical protein
VISEAQKIPSSSEPRRGPGRPRKDGLQSQKKDPASQSVRGWHSYGLSAPPRVIDRDVNGEAMATTPSMLPPAPLTKEMVARKRTFAEIIDLTSEDIPASVEDHPLIVSKVGRVGDTNFQRADGYDGAQEPKAPNGSFKFRSPSATTTTCVPKPSLSPHRTSSTLAVASSVPSHYKDFEDIVRPIDRSVALRKSRYDPKAICT